MQPILDPACASRMFYFDKKDKRVLFGDLRCEEHVLCDGRKLVIAPDAVMDFRHLPFADSTFYQVIFDPPHLLNVGPKSWLAKKYGKLNRAAWQEDLRRGFAECFRVLKPFGTLIFKWSEKDIPLAEILKLTPQKPVIGHRGRIKYPFHWIAFLKEEANDE